MAVRDFSSDGIIVLVDEMNLPAGVPGYVSVYILSRRSYNKF